MGSPCCELSGDWGPFRKGGCTPEYSANHRPVGQAVRDPFQSLPAGPPWVSRKAGGRGLAQPGGLRGGGPWLLDEATLDLMKEYEDLFQKK